MPSRIIREGWLESETVNQLNAEDERFYLRLMLRADDFGRYHANPVLLRSALYPLKDDVRTTDVSRWLAACEKAGLVRCYTHAQKPYLEIPKFGQRTRADTSKFPEPPAQADTGLLTGISLTEAAGASGKRPAHAGHLPGKRPASAGHTSVKRPSIDGPPRTDSETKSKSNLSPPAGAGGKRVTPIGGEPRQRPGDSSRAGSGQQREIPDERNYRRLFEALARAEGSDPDRLTGSHGGRIGKALKEILAACPTLTIEDVDRAAAQYRKVMPKGTKLTASALASNWGKCASALVMPSKGEAEPTGWRETMTELFPGNLVSGDSERTWASVDADTRAKVLAHQKRNGRAA